MPVGRFTTPLSIWSFRPAKTCQLSRVDFALLYEILLAAYADPSEFLLLHLRVSLLRLPQSRRRDIQLAFLNRVQYRKALFAKFGYHF